MVEVCARKVNYRQILYQLGLNVAANYTETQTTLH